MPPIRSRPAPEGVLTVPPSLFLITSPDRRRDWRRDAPLGAAATSIEIDLRTPVPEDDSYGEITLDPRE